MHFVAALDRVPGMRCVLGLFEGVVAGAADGYARMADKPAATLLHCGPGLANGLANFHNARRANVPLVSIVGDQATYHKPLDPLLAADTDGFANAVSRWVRTARTSAEVGVEAAAAVTASRAAPGGIATLILPSDASWSEGGAVAPAQLVQPPRKVDEAAIAGAIRALRSGEPAMILLAGKSLRASATADASRVAAATGARISGETFNTRVKQVNKRDPVAFFAYPGKPGRLLPADASVHVLAAPEEDGPDALARLADALGAPAFAPPPSGALPAAPKGAVTPEAFATALTALLPENAIVADEGLTFGFAVYPNTHGAVPHDWLQLTGGAIGDGLPMATGAAIGAPGRRVVTLQGDGSALYTVQALWTQARERLDVTTVMFSNRRYEILFDELTNVGAQSGAASRVLFDLGNPDLDWLAIARGFGVEAARADTMEQFADIFTAANRRRGPFLIDLAIP
jgi:acetolactate synthase-1/2/3 large subunit